MSFVGKASLVAAFKLANSVLGVVQTFAVARVFGVTKESDALFVALFIPVIAARQFGRVLRGALVPCLVEQEDDPDHRFVATFATWWLALAVTLCLLLVIFTPVVTKLQCPGFDAETFDLTRNLLRIMAPCLIMLCLCGSLQASCHSKRKFVAPELTQLVWRLIALVFLLRVAPQHGVKAYAWGLVLASVVEFGFLLFMTPDRSIVIPKAWPRWDSALMRPLLKGSAVVFAGFFLVRAGEYISRVAASYMEEGTVSVLRYASALASRLPTVVATSFFAVFLPEMAALRTRGRNVREFSGTVVLFLSILGIPLAAMLFWFSPELIDLLVATGRFSRENAVSVAWTVQAFALGVPPTFWGMGLRGIFVVERDLGRMVKSRLLQLLVLVGSLLVLYRYGAPGFGLAASITAYAGFIYLLAVTGVRLHATKELRPLLVATAAFLAMLFGVPWRNGPFPPVVNAAAGMIVSSIVCAALVYPSFHRLKNRIKSLIREGASRPSEADTPLPETGTDGM